MHDEYSIDQDALYRANLQSIRDQLNEQVTRAALKFKNPFVSWVFDGLAWHITITEAVPTTVIMR